MKLIVCVKQVPDTSGKVAVNAEARWTAPPCRPSSTPTI